MSNSKIILMLSLLTMTLSPLHATQHKLQAHASRQSKLEKSGHVWFKRVLAHDRKTRADRTCKPAEYLVLPALVMTGLCVGYLAGYIETARYSIIPMQIPIA